MQFYDVIKKRVSIKNFKDTKICEEKLDRMVNAAMMSPTWRNHSSYRFILVDDKSKINQISEAVLNNDNVAANSIKQAPMSAIIVASERESGHIDDKDFYLVDSAIAMEHFVLSATEEGYGTCWIAALDEEKIKGILSIPKEFRVIALTPIGEIAKCEEHADKKDIRDFIFLNEWDKSYTENKKK